MSAKGSTATSSVKKAESTPIMSALTAKEYRYAREKYIASAGVMASCAPSEAESASDTGLGRTRANAFDIGRVKTISPNTADTDSTNPVSNRKKGDRHRHIVPPSPSELSVSARPSRYDHITTAHITKERTALGLPPVKRTYSTSTAVLTIPTGWRGSPTANSSLQSAADMSAMCRPLTDSTCPMPARE